MDKKHQSWKFPLSRPYTGILLGNGSMGVMVWGSEILSLTVSRTGFWDHRGGRPFSSQLSYKELHRLLHLVDDQSVKNAFATFSYDLPYQTPTQLPGGRLDLRFASQPKNGLLNLANGKLRIEMSDGTEVAIRLSPECDILWIGGSAKALSVELIPAWRWMESILSSGKVEPPSEWNDPECGGFFQPLPDDPGLTIGWHESSEGICVATALGNNTGDRLMVDLKGQKHGPLEVHADAWWEKYDQSIPKIRIPDEKLQQAWDYGLYKQAAMTPPTGLPATLQGPWMAENELPLWSNDFHFNINLQMIYWPALPTNRAEHLSPLWTMIISWLPMLKANAAKFFGNSKACMLPHAVDDQCHTIGQFWQAMIDQACTAWIAQLAWLHYRHSMNIEVLREVAWPLLTGAFEGFCSMSEELESDGTMRLSLPVSVSPEFEGWGRDSSFQLAAFHMLAGILPKAARILGLPVDDRWEQVRQKLPLFSTMRLAKVWGVEEARPRIVLWEGKDLTESHRHHSHLAAIYPFCTVDVGSAAHRDVIRRSLEHWVAMGPGQWVGWSMPWASIIWARCNYASSTVSLLRIWEDIFTNEGHGTLHNADSPGYSEWIHGPFFDWPDIERKQDQMQMDSGFGVIQAIVEIFIQQRGEQLHVLPSIPKQWQDFEFDGILTEGAFLVGATVRNAQTVEIRIRSLAGEVLSLCHGMLGRWCWDGGEPQIGYLFEYKTLPGQTITLRSL